MPTIETDYEGLKGMAKEFLEAMPALDMPGLDNGLKCFSLAYIGCTFKHESENIMAQGLWAFINRKYFDREFELLQERNDANV